MDIDICVPLFLLKPVCNFKFFLKYKPNFLKMCFKNQCLCGFLTDLTNKCNFGIILS